MFSSSHLRQWGGMIVRRAIHHHPSCLPTPPPPLLCRSSQPYNVNKSTASKVRPTSEEQAIHLSKARLAGRTKWYLERNPRIWKERRLQWCCSIYKKTHTEQSTKYREAYEVPWPAKHNTDSNTTTYDVWATTCHHYQKRIITRLVTLYRSECVVKLAAVLAGLLRSRKPHGHTLCQEWRAKPVKMKTTSMHKAETPGIWIGMLSGLLTDESSIMSRIKMVYS